MSTGSVCEGGDESPLDDPVFAADAGVCTSGGVKGRTVTDGEFEVTRGSRFGMGIGLVMVGKGY